MWKGSQAERVCAACFGGDVEAMRRHARAYLEGGPGTVLHLGEKFRAIILTQNRHNWWTRALRIIDNEFPVERKSAPASGGDGPPPPPPKGSDERRIDPARDSSYLESVRENVFLAEIQKDGVVRRGQPVKVLRPDVDDEGYDLMLVCNGVRRFIQLKSKSLGGAARSWNVHQSLLTRPSGCVILLEADRDLNLRYRWLGGEPDQPIAGAVDLKVAKHAKGDSKGHKHDRPRLRQAPLSMFKALPTVKELSDSLFGTPSRA